MPIKKHENGPLNVTDGSITNGVRLYNTIAIIIDTGVGTFQKYGEAVKIKERYDEMISRFAIIDPSMAQDLTYIEFNVKSGDTSWDDYHNAQLSKDEICTIINYFMNCIGEERMNQILKMDAETLNKELEKLADIGF